MQSENGKQQSNSIARAAPDTKRLIDARNVASRITTRRT